jgi:hypothetical protein
MEPGKNQTMSGSSILTLGYIEKIICKFRNLPSNLRVLFTLTITIMPVYSIHCWIWPMAHYLIYNYKTGKDKSNG